MTAEEFFKQSDYQAQIQNKRDKEFHYFSYFDMIEFAEQYHMAKKEEVSQKLLNEIFDDGSDDDIENPDNYYHSI